MKYSRSLVATLLMSGGLLNSVAPAFAQTVPLPAANSEISNTATATYTDPADTTNTPINTVSNTVTVTVAKIAGIVVKEVNFTQPNAADAFKPGETVYSNFEVTNTGNDGVTFRIPKLADVSANVTFTKVQYNAGTVAAPIWTDVTDVAGATSATIAVGGKLQVRIVSVINANAVAGDDIITTLGNTSTPGLPNVERGIGTETIDGRDIYTVDVLTPGANVALGGTAKNGVRESSATQKVKVNAVKQAFATVTVTNDAATPNATTPLTKDDVKYNLSILVPTTNPTGNGAVATDLAPTAIKLATTDLTPTTAGTDVNRVIVIDPLTTGTVLKAVPVAPTGWTPVYAITSPDPAVPTVWSTVPPTDLTTVKQVGFIYEPTGATAPASVPAPTGTSLPATNTPYTGFSVTVITPQLGTQLPDVVSIVGTTPTATGAPDPTKPVVASGTDTVTTSRAPVISALYNGPVNKPEATGPGNSIETDFTNKSMALTPADAVRDAVTGLLIPTVTSSVVTFNNTIENKTNVAGDVYLLPTAPAVAADLPNGTMVKIKNINGIDTRSYTYNNGVFTPITAEAGLVPLKLAVGANGLVSYSVDVTLPAGQKQLTGFPVSITAFAGATAPTTAMGIPAGSVTNTTIDRVYTGYIDLIKEARLLDVITDQNNTTIQYVSGADAKALQAVPGKFIQYRIRAKNIVDAAAGSVDSPALSATNLNVKEDGLAAPNSWGNTTTHAPDSAKTFLGTSLLPAGTVSYDLGTKNNTQPTVSRYDANLGAAVIAPGQEGSFTFVRQVNKP
jgi:hypothetical protein